MNIFPIKKDQVKRPKYYRAAEGHIFSWEIYDRHEFFLVISFFSFEIQINKYPYNHGQDEDS